MYTMTNLTNYLEVIVKVVHLDTLCTPQEVKQFDELKSDVVRRVLQFVTYLLKSSLKDPSLVQVRINKTIY